MKPESRFWLWIGMLSLALPTLVVGQTILFLKINHIDLSALPTSLRKNIFTFLFLAVLSGMPILIWLLRYFYKIYVRPIHQFSEDIEAIIHSGPNARLILKGNRSIEKLAQGLNHILQKHDDVHQTFGKMFDRSLEEIRQERDMLESVLNGIIEGVILCDPQGDIVLYNKTASKLFRSNKLFGTGRTINKIFNKELVLYCLDKIREEIKTGVEMPSSSFTSTIYSKLPVKMAPILSSKKQMEGYILIFSYRDDDEIRPTSLDETMHKLSKKASGTILEKKLAEKHFSELRYVVFDLETTGLEPSQGDEIISIGAVSIVKNKIVVHEVFDQLVDPLKPISPASIEIHRITQDMVSGKPKVDRVLKSFRQFSDGAVLVAHNAAFDMKFLKMKESVAGVEFDNPVLDTMLLSSVIHPHQPAHNLDRLVQRYGIALKDRHAALGDAWMTAELFLRILPQLEKRHIINVSQAVEASRKVPLAGLTY
ncbi:MAG: hypothetical protein GY801_22695 [bacterium]|nr:hypothetical protein [bacterium]